MGSLALLGKQRKEKGKSEFKPLALRLRIVFVSQHVPGWVNTHTHTHTHMRALSWDIVVSEFELLR